MKKIIQLIIFLMVAGGHVHASRLSVEVFREDNNPVFVSVDHGQKGFFYLVDKDETRIFNSGVAKINSVTYYDTVLDNFFQLELNQPGVLLLGADLTIGDLPEEILYRAPNYKIRPSGMAKYTWQNYQVRK